MESLFDYKMIIVDEKAHIHYYEKEFGIVHEDCLLDYSKKRKYSFVNGELFIRPEYVVKEGNIIFYNVGNNMAMIYLPSKLTEEQLYQLDYLENFLESTNYLAVGTFDENGEIVDDYTFDNPDYDDVLGTPRNRFSNEVIQSYYKVRGKKR